MLAVHQRHLGELVKPLLPKEHPSWDGTQSISDIYGPSAEPCAAELQNHWCRAADDPAELGCQACEETMEAARFSPQTSALVLFR